MTSSPASREERFSRPPANSDYQYQGCFQVYQAPVWSSFGIGSFSEDDRDHSSGIPHAICYIDNILITGCTEDEHTRNLEEMLWRLQQHGKEQIPVLPEFS